jgi:hypothetical protein
MSETSLLVASVRIYLSGSSAPGTGFYRGCEGSNIIVPSANFSAALAVTPDLVRIRPWAFEVASTMSPTIPHHA